MNAREIGLGVTLTCLVAGGAITAAAGAQSAERPDSDAGEAKIRDLRPKVRGLERKVTSQGGTVSRRDDSRETRLGLSADVLFRFGSARLTSRSRRALREVASGVDDRDSGGTVSVVGFTDAKGSPGLNQRLSTRRARAVERALSSLTEDDTRYRVSGRGERDPVAPNTRRGRDNPAGRRLNRRVEVRFRR